MTATVASRAAQKSWFNDEVVVVDPGVDNSREEFLTIWGAAAHTSHEEPGYRIERPLLITHGETDRPGNISKIDPGWAARDPNSRYVVVPGAGHNANQDNPTYFDRLLLEFLDEH